MKKEIKLLLAELVRSDFPSLNSYDISLRTDTDCDYIAAVSRYGHQITIWLDKDDIKKMNTLAQVGALAHELCHAERDLQKSMMRRFTEAALSLVIPSVTTNDERATDELVIAKGYGKALLAFHIYHDRHYASYSQQDGLTKKEIRARLKQRENDKAPPPVNG